MLNLFLFVYISLSYTVSGYWANLHRYTSRRQCSMVLSPYNTQFNERKYPLSRRYYEQYLKRLNRPMKNESYNRMDNDMFDEWMRSNSHNPNNSHPTNNKPNEIQIIINTSPYAGYGSSDDSDKKSEFDRFRAYRGGEYKVDKKSDNFEVVQNSPYTFKDIGGYANIKKELHQCIDLLTNYEKYAKYNVRIPKGLILEGPPGTGKTLIAKSLAGEAKVGYIAVSGSSFQEKYVGIGPARIRELFALAKKNIPCIIFIDEIDAVGRKRSGDGESSSSERDSTLNELLVGLDGFKNTTGILLVGATNRADLLDSALIRPGRVDKRVYIGLPDEATREHIINIHIQGKPRDSNVLISDLVDKTSGLSGAQIENLLNEAMLHALRENREAFTDDDISFVTDRLIAGWQPMEHELSDSIVDHIAVHEMGHGLLSLYAKHHSPMRKVVINLSSPTSPGYTLFEPFHENIYTREYLLEHLMILLGGRIAEEVIYGHSVTTGAINDFEEAFKMAEKMILAYGFGKNVIYPKLSEKYKEKIDDEVIHLLNDAYDIAKNILQNKSELILECAEFLKQEKMLTVDTVKSIYEKYNYDDM